MAKKEDITIEQARELVSDAILWPLARTFLWDFATQIHESWIDGLWPVTPEAEGGDAPVAALVRGLSSSPRVKRLILSSLGVEPCFHAFPKDDWSRLLLLDCATLESVAKWLGALACSGSLRHVTDGATVRSLKTSLAGVYPEVLTYTMYFKSLAAANVERSGGESFASIGLAMLLSLLSGIPAPLLDRLRLKLPRDLCSEWPPRDAGVKKAVVQDSLHRLLKLKFPEAYSLCC